MEIRSYRPEYGDAVVRLSLDAWSPVFSSIEQVMLPEVYRAFYPEGWQASQEKAVREVCNDPEQHVWVADEEGSVVGFIAVRLHTDDGLGEIHMMAVDPECQQRGLGAALTEYAVGWMREAGMTVAMVETGGDPGHAPARRTYEQAGFDVLPVSRYFKKL